MYLTVKQQMKHLSAEQKAILKDLCHTAKNLRNQAAYNVRQEYFKNKKYLCYEANYKILKASENYKRLNANMAQQTIRVVDKSYKAFFGMIKKVKSGDYSSKACRIPGYLPKDGYDTLIMGRIVIDKHGTFAIPYSAEYKEEHNPIRIRVPPVLNGKKIKEIRIVPKADAEFFEVQYIYEEQEAKPDIKGDKALAIDLGINNLITAVTSTGQTFIIDGRYVKSVNQGYNKERARLESIKNKQNYGYGSTKKMKCISKNRHNRIDDYMSKTVSKVIRYCMDNGIGTVIVGYNDDWQDGSNMGARNNQNFTYISFGKLIKKLSCKCQKNGIKIVMQEESYTSKASFWDRDWIPVYKQGDRRYKFSGKRIARGQYRTGTGMLVNADINGALNIMRKSNVVSMDALYARGAVDTPVRIRVV